MCRRPLLLGVVCVFFVAGPAIGQLPPSGVIRGRVVDPQQAPLEDVRVTLTDLSSAKPLTAHTDLAGRFAFTRLPSAKYSLTFDLAGYAVQQLRPYEVLPGVPVEISAELKPLAAPLTRPRGGLEGIAIEYGLVREQIEAMPVLLGSEGRTPVDKLLSMVPGASPTQSLEVNPFTGRAAAVSANGSRPSAINYQLDGGSNNAQNRITGAQATTFGPMPEAIETFRVVSHTYSAQDGRNAGAVVSATTRSGGNEWHGQARGFWRPRGSNTIETFDGSNDSINGWAGGGQIGGTLSKKKGLFLFLDAEAWGTRRRETEISPVLTVAERSGDFSSLPAQNAPRDPQTNMPFVNGIVPAGLFDPLVTKYLDTFVPAPNEGEDLYRSERDLDGDGEMLLGRLDWRRSNWSLNFSYFNFRNRVDEPFRDVGVTAPGLVSRRTQRSHNAQITLSYAPGPSFSNSVRLAGQRLSSNRRQGRPDFIDTPTDSFGFDFQTYGADPSTLPDVTLLAADGLERLRIVPFLFAESSAQTSFQVRDDLAYRHRGLVLRGGAMFRRSIWPFSNTENEAGSFTFSSTAFRGTRNSVADLLLGIPATYRLTTPRSLNMRWNEFALYGESEVRPFRGMQITAGVRYESQPPAVERLDRLAAFRRSVESQSFDDTLPNLIFPGDPDGDLGLLPRSTIRTDGKHFVPRVGLAYSPTSENKLSRWIFGESGRSVFRASYGVFYDFGTFAGSSAAALFQATYPPFSTDTRFDFARLARTGNFRAPLSVVPPVNTGLIRGSLVTYPILVFDPLFDNAMAQHWAVGWQRLLPHRVFLSATYVGTRSRNLQRQQEVNEFRRSALLGFGSIRNMRLFSQYQNIRSFESSGTARYHGMHLKATRYLTRGLAFDMGYTWSSSFDNASSSFGDAFNTEPWAASDFDRRHMLTATWFYRLRLPRDMALRTPWADDWQISGIWRMRSGLPLDVRQTEDPTFSFERVGRPDLVGTYTRLDPGQIRTFADAEGREVSGRFAFDLSAFQAVVPTDFDELRQGTLGRNAVRMHGFQQWDLRIAKSVAITETMSTDFGIDMLNAFNNQNWAAPFRNVDNPYFGIVRSEGLQRTFQLNVRFRF